MMKEWIKEMENFINVSYKMLNKLEYLLGRAWGWICVIGFAVFNYFQPALHIYYAILGLIAIDAILGVWVSKKKGSFALSYLGRESSWKILFYTLLFMAIHIFESTFGSHLNIGLIVAFAVAGAFELLSITANGTILKPNLPFLRFLSKYIKGEISHKLGISEEDVENVLLGSVSDMRSDREKNKIKEVKEAENEGKET